MLLKPELLLPALKKNLPALIWVTGDEPLLMQECCDSVRAFARENGFTDREVMHAGRDFQWSELLHSTGSMSLFGDKKLIELRLNSVKLDQEHKNILHSLLESPQPDNLLLVSSPKLDKATLKTKWFAPIEQAGFIVQIWPVKSGELPGWIARRLKQLNMEADQEAVQVLADRVEGNLLAATQELEKLHVLHAGTRLDARTIAMSVADNSRYSVFELIDSSLAGQTAKALKILSHLKGEGEEVLRISNLLTFEIFNLTVMQEQVDRGQNIHSVIKAARVWYNRQSLVESALKRHNLATFEAIIQKLRLIELSVKGSMNASPWLELENIILRLAGHSADTSHAA